MKNNMDLIHHIERFTRTLDTKERESIPTYFIFEKVPKKGIIQKADTPCDVLCFVLQGCLRSYYIKRNGLEQTVDFAIEHWWLTDFLSFEQQKTSSFYIQATEPTAILRITTPNFTALLLAHPIMEKYFRSIFQKAYGAAQYRLMYLYELSREELYFHFEAQFPEFIQRIPQYLIASYLGFSPEYLSEIKKKRFS
ncbi:MULTISPECIES: Crp/Fnr family transcriptional regulator [unclassified Myroides]|uniref:Crp/Fnr family transcriptional regulator n=1 Tax=unclassified Myroides TaxID=2642485 RepID=UPI003D2F7563